MSPDGSLCASGGKDAKAMLWDLNDGKHLYTLDHAGKPPYGCFIEMLRSGFAMTDHTV